MKKILIILGAILEVIALTEADYNKRIIISDYSGSYESINTYACRSLFLLKIAKQLQGYKVFNKYPNIRFEWFDPSKDQVTYHSPWSFLK